MKKKDKAYFKKEEIEIIKRFASVMRQFKKSDKEKKR